MMEERDVSQIPLSQRGKCYFEMGILISACSLEVYADAVFLNRGHWCACPCGMSRTDHLDGKWVGLSARLASPEKSPTGISPLLGGCSVPLCPSNFCFGEEDRGIAGVPPSFDGAGNACF